MFMDLELATRLERTEAMVGASFIEARNAVASIGAAWQDFAGTTAIFDGAGSPLTQTFGLGVSSPVTAEQLAAIEAFFTARGADTMHEVSPFAGAEGLGLLVERRYRPIELSNVLVQQIGTPAPVASALRVRVIDPAVDAAVWVETSVGGWSDPAIAAFVRSIAEVNVRNRSLTHYLVERDGAAIATASLGIHEGVALLAGASTLPASRGLGAQALVLSTRLADARDRGCSVAMMVAAVGSTSQRNAERNGFRVAYTRTKWQRAASE